jgi:hypothetical protein
MNLVAVVLALLYGLISIIWQTVDILDLYFRYTAVDRLLIVLVEIVPSSTNRNEYNDDKQFLHMKQYVITAPQVPSVIIDIWLHILSISRQTH